MISSCLPVAPRAAEGLGEAAAERRVDVLGAGGEHRAVRALDYADDDSVGRASRGALWLMFRVVVTVLSLVPAPNP